MSNVSTTYQLKSLSGVSNHGWSPVQYFRDREDEQHEEGVISPTDASVHSGDYFVTVAMKLDILARQTEDVAVKSTIEDIVSELIYLQDTYKIVKNKHNR